MFSTPSFNVSLFDKNTNKDWIIGTYRGVFLKKAEEDYIACRVLFMLNLNDLACYHFQQCIEKYLKAYILDNKIINSKGEEPTRKNIRGHNLKVLLRMCCSRDDFFKDEKLQILKDISYLESLSRYPGDVVRGCGYSKDSLLEFLDEFVFEMRNKIKHNQYPDIISNFQQGFIMAHPSLSPEFKISSDQIKSFITFKNDYFK